MVSLSNHEAILTLRQAQGEDNPQTEKDPAGVGPAGSSEPKVTYSGLTVAARSRSPASLLFRLPTRRRRACIQDSYFIDIFRP